MPIVLSDRVVKFVFTLKNGLRPIFRVFTTSYPTLIALCLYDKNSKRRNDYVVYLNSIAIAFKKQIVECYIFIG